MSIVKRLQECSSYTQAIPLLKEVNAKPALHKIVETALLLKNHPDPHQREYGANFMRTALQELEMDKDEQPTPHHDDGVTVKKDKIIKEEELAGGNPDGTEGSEQSSDNEGPYPQVGTEEPNSDIESMQGGAASGDNQMKEGGPMGMFPGIEPGVAQEIGNHMPQIPPMNTGQQMRQMQYTVNQAVRAYVIPLRNQIQKQQEAIKVLVRQVQESEARTGSMKLDLGKIQSGSQARVIQEATGLGDPIFNPKPSQIHHKVFELEKARSEIAQMDKAIRQSGTYIQ